MKHSKQHHHDHHHSERTGRRRRPRRPRLDLAFKRRREDHLIDAPQWRVRIIAN